MSFIEAGEHQWLGSQVLLPSEEVDCIWPPDLFWEGAGLDLTRVGAHGQIRNGRILCLARTMRDDGSIANLLSDLNYIKGFAQCPDLVEFNEDRVSHFFSNPLHESIGVGNKKGRLLPSMIDDHLFPFRIRVPIYIYWVPERIVMMAVP